MQLTILPQQIQDVYTNMDSPIHVCMCTYKHLYVRRVGDNLVILKFHYELMQQGALVITLSCNIIHSIQDI